jgi:hypothetical protein
VTLAGAFAGGGAEHLFAFELHAALEERANPAAMASVPSCKTSSTI